MPFSAALWGLLVGAATIAWWILARYPRVAPQTKRGVTAWFCVSFTATGFAPAAFAPLSEITGPFAAFLLVVLPSGVCTMLAAASTVRFVGELIGPRR